MDSKNEFLKQLNRKIAQLEKQLAEASEDLKRSIDNTHITLIHGLARSAESVTKITGQLEALYEQREAFEHIFNIE